MDSFQDQYLGTFSSNPTVDLDGNALQTGALFFSSTTNSVKVYDGSQWLDAYASLSGALIANNNLSDLTNAATARTNLGLSEFTSPQVLADGTVKTLAVKVITKTAAHPYYNVGSTLGFTIDDVESPFIELIIGNTYKFDQSDSSNASHPLRLYYDLAKNRAYTTNITTSGTPGSSGAYTQIVVTEATPRVLFYQCSAHANMGFYVASATDNNYGFSEIATSAPASGANYPPGYIWYVVS